MRDLEIRGAGSLLGEIQHGHIDEVGYDTYCKILDEVIKENKGIKVEEDIDVVIDINVSSYIPDSYIENNSQKLETYRNIALCRTEEDIENISNEITDRYGKMPKEVRNLINIARIKEMCKELGINKVMQKQNNIVFYIEQDKLEIDIPRLVEKYKNNIKFSNGMIPYITYKIQDMQNIILEIKEVLASDNNK